MTHAYPPIVDLVPHRPPCLMLESIESWAETGLVCRARCRHDSPFRLGSQVPAYVALEIAAQAAAADQALRLRARNRTPAEALQGFLVNAWEVVLPPGALPNDVNLNVRVTLDATAGPLASYGFEVSGGPTFAVSGRLSAMTAAPDRVFPS